MFAAAIFGSFVLYLVIGAAVGRKVKDTSDYFVAGRAAPVLLVAGTLVASFLSTVSFMGELGFAYDGFPVVMLILTCFNVSGYVVGVVFFGRFLRRSQAMTVPEYFGKRFNSAGIQALAGAMVVVGIGLYLIAVTQGLTLVVSQLVDLPNWAVLVIVWASYTIFTFMSGSRGVLINDTLMFIVFTIAAIVGMAWVIGEAGGPVVAMQKMAELSSKPEALSWHGVTGEANYMFAKPLQALVYAVTFGVVWATVVAVSPWQSSRFLMARDEHVAVRSGIVAMVVLAITYVFLMFGGFSINLFNDAVDPSETAFIWAAKNVLPSVLGVIAVTGIVAAGLSSAASFLSLIGFSASNDVLPYLRGRRYTEENPYDESRAESRGATDSANEEPASTAVTLWTARITMLLAGLIVLAVTWVAPPSLLAIGYFAATLFAASWGPVAFWSVRSPKLSTRGAAVGMVAGFVAIAVCESLSEFGSVEFPSLLNPTIIGFMASIGGILIANIGATPSAAGNRYRERLTVTPPEDRNNRKLAVTRWYMLVGVAGLATCSVAMLAFYAIPLL